MIHARGSTSDARDQCVTRPIMATTYIKYRGYRAHETCKWETAMCTGVGVQVSSVCIAKLESKHMNTDIIIFNIIIFISTYK